MKRVKDDKDVLLNKTGKWKFESFGSSVFQLELSALTMLLNDKTLLESSQNLTTDKKKKIVSLKMQSKSRFVHVNKNSDLS